MIFLKSLGLRFWLVFIFGLCYTLTLFNEIIPVRDGLGFDGYHYYKVVLDGINQLVNKTINGYHFFRIFPYIFFDIFSLPKSIGFTLSAFKIINLIAIGLSIYYYFLICKFYELKENVSNIGFILLFYSFPILKYVNYNPMQTDHLSFFFSIIGFYFTLKKNHFMIGLIVLLSLFNFPSLSIILLILNLAPTNDGVKLFAISRSQFKYWVGILCVLLLSLSYIFFKEIKVNNPIPLYYGTLVNTKLLIPSFIMLAVYFLYVIFSLFRAKIEIISIKFSPIYFIVFIIVIIFILFIFETYPPLGEVKNGNGMSISTYAIRALNMPLNFLVYHIFYYGVIFVFFIFYMSEIFEYSIKNGIGYFLCILFTYIFMIQNESRVLINLIPFLLIALLNVLNQKEISKNKTLILAFIGLVFSRFYIQINYDHQITQSLTSPREYGYYPAQMYFMNSGPWVSYNNYKLEFLISILLLFLFLLFFADTEKLKNSIFKLKQIFKQ